MQPSEEGDTVSNRATEQVAIDLVMQLERTAGRIPRDTRFTGEPYDISSPPRKIEVKAFGKSARGQALPLEDRQVRAAKADPENFFVYVVDNINAGFTAMAVRAVHGVQLAALIDRTKPVLTYWP